MNSNTICLIDEAPVLLSQLGMGKTIRFGDLVRESGRPHVVTLWIDPEKDPSFQKAVRESRVVTVHADPASHKKEYGEIGFHRGHGNTYVVFPRPLPDEQARIVGINYQLTEEPPPPSKDLVSRVEVKPRKKEKTKPAVVEPEPEPKTFDVVVRRTAVLEESQRVKGLSEEAARDAALAAIKGKAFDADRTRVRVEIVSVTETRD